MNNSDYSYLNEFNLDDYDQDKVSSSVTSVETPVKSFISAYTHITDPSLSNTDSREESYSDVLHQLSALVNKISQTDDIIETQRIQITKKELELKRLEQDVLRSELDIQKHEALQHNDMCGELGYKLGENQDLEVWDFFYSFYDSILKDKNIKNQSGIPQIIVERIEKNQFTEFQKYKELTEQNEKEQQQVRLLNTLHTEKTKTEARAQPYVSSLPALEKQLDLTTNIDKTLVDEIVQKRVSQHAKYQEAVQLTHSFCIFDANFKRQQHSNKEKQDKLLQTIETLEQELHRIIQKQKKVYPGRRVMK